MTPRNYQMDGLKILIWTWIGAAVFIFITSAASAISSILIKLVLFVIIFRGLAMWLSGIILGFGHIMDYVDRVKGKVNYYHETTPAPKYWPMIALLAISVLAASGWNGWQIVDIFRTESLGFAMFTTALGVAAMIYGVMAFGKEIKKQ